MKKTISLDTISYVNIFALKRTFQVYLQIILIGGMINASVPFRNFDRILNFPIAEYMNSWISSFLLHLESFRFSQNYGKY